MRSDDILYVIERHGSTEELAEVTARATDDVTPGRASRALAMRLDLRNHSPTGFEFGYGGSGPAQLSLALCADFLEDDARACRVYMRFKSVVAAAKGSSWSITGAEIRGFVERVEREDDVRCPHCGCRRGTVMAYDPHKGWIKCAECGREFPAEAA